MIIVVFSPAEQHPKNVVAIYEAGPEYNHRTKESEEFMDILSPALVKAEASVHIDPPDRYGFYE